MGVVTIAGCIDEIRSNVGERATRPSGGRRIGILDSWTMDNSLSVVAPWVTDMELHDVIATWGAGAW